MNVKKVAQFLKHQRTSGESVADPFGEISTDANSSEMKKLPLEIKDDLFYKDWTDINVDILRKQKIMKITQTKEEIDLHRYLIRRSNNKSRVCLAL